MSFALFNAARVVQACDSYLQARKESIEKEREPLIEREMTKFWFPAKTREKAVARLKAGDSFSPWYMVSISGAYWASRVREIRNMAKLAGTEIYLSQEEAKTLDKHLENVE